MCQCQRARERFCYHENIQYEKVPRAGPPVPVLVLVVVVGVAGAESAHLALLLPLRDDLVAPRLQRLDRRPPHHR